MARRKRSGDRAVVLIETDHHAGHRWGLLNPRTELKDGTDEVIRPHLREIQRYIDSKRNAHLDAVAELADGDQVVYIHLGDATQGTKYKEQLVTTRLGDQPVIAAWNLMPVVERMDIKMVRYMTSTPVHAEGENSLDTLTMDAIKARIPGLDVDVHQHGLYTINGVEFDCAHHGPHPGIRDWTEGGVARLYLRNRMIIDLKRGVEPPQVYARGHHHKLQVVRHDEVWGDKVYSSMLVIVPGYCGLSEHARKVTQSAHLQRHGLAAFEILGGKLATKVCLKWDTLDLRIKETLC